MTYDEFIEGINNPNKIKQIDFYCGINLFKVYSLWRQFLSTFTCKSSSTL